MMRDNFSQKTKSALAHRVGFKCSNPDCRQLTSGPSDAGSEQHVNIGVAAHICAASKGGPRFDNTMDSLLRTSFDNGIWLCQSCAKLIDSDEKRYTKQLLLVWKKSAEDLALAELSGEDSINKSVNEEVLLQSFKSTIK